MKVAHYIRFSTEQQVKGASLQSQMDRLNAASRDAGEEVFERYIDQAVSGTTIDHRKEYQRLLHDARQKRFQRVRVETVDRGHRNAYDWIMFEREMTLLNIDVMYCDESSDIPEDTRRLLRHVKVALGEQEVAQTSHRTYDRQATRVRQGRRYGGTIHYGLLPDGAGYKPDPETYPVLIWILERRAEGFGFQRITKMLNTGGCETPKPPPPALVAWRRKHYMERVDPFTGEIVQIPKPQPRDVWQTTTIRHICHEAAFGVYAGVLTWGKLRRKHKYDRYGNKKEAITADLPGGPLIPQSLVDRVRIIESQDGRYTPAYQARGISLLHLICGQCGHKVYANTTTNNKKRKDGTTKKYYYRVYRCNGRSVLAGKCTMPQVRCNPINRAIVQSLIEYVASMHASPMAEALSSAVAQYRNELSRGLEGCVKLQRQLEDERQQAIQTVLDHRVASAIIQAINDRVTKLDDQLNELSQTQRVIEGSIRTLDERARSIMAVLESGTLQDSILDRIGEPAVIQQLQPIVQMLIKQATIYFDDKRSARIELEVRTIAGFFRENGQHEDTDSWQPQAQNSPENSMSRRPG